MKPAQILSTARKAFASGNREQFTAVLNSAPLSPTVSARFLSDPFDNRLQSSSQYSMVELAIEELSPRLKQYALSNPSWWEEWSAHIPGIDTALLLNSHDPQWFELLSFRWLNAGGTPAHNQQWDKNARSERDAWINATIQQAVNDGCAFAIDQMLQRPAWKAHFTNKFLPYVAYTSTDVWDVLHKHGQPLPWNMMWNMALYSGTTLPWLLRQDNANSDFVANQYLSQVDVHFSTKTDLHSLLGERMHGTQPADKKLQAFHLRILKQWNDVLTQGRHIPNPPHFLDPKRLVEALRSTPFDIFFFPGSEGWQQINTAIEQLSNEQKTALADKDMAAFCVFPAWQHWTISSHMPVPQHTHKAKKI